MNDADRLSAADEVNLLLDSGTDVYVLTVAGLLGPGGAVSTDGTADVQALRAAVDARTRGIPRMRRTLVGSGLVEAPLDVAQHVRLLARVEGITEFEAVCAGLATRRLPRDRPLWELLFVPGAAPGRAGWVFRIHHAIADGTTAARLLEDLFDPVDEDEPSTPAGGASAHARTPTASARRRWPLLRSLLHPMRPTALLGPRTAALHARTTHLPLAAAVVAAGACGGTVNDLVLAAVGDAVASALRVLGEPPPSHVPVSVPVLLPRGRRSPNQVSAAIIRVPLASRDLADAVREIANVSRESISGARSRPLPWASRTRLGGRVMRWFLARQRMVGVLTTNVRGPSGVRSLAGAPIVRVWALPVLAGTVRLGVAVVSYAGDLAVTPAWDGSLGAAGDAFADAVGAALSRVVEPTPPS